MLDPNRFSFSELGEIIDSLVEKAIRTAKAEEADSLAQMTPERQQAAIARATESVREQLTDLSRYVLARDAKALHRWSQMIRRRESESLFATMLGITLPKTQKALVAALAEFIGDEWDRTVDERRRQREAELTARKEQRAAAAMKLALSRKVKASPLGGGVVRTISVGELIDELADAGYSPVTRRRGVITVCDMVDPTFRRRMTFDRKLEVAYCLERAKENAAPVIA